MMIDDGYNIEDTLDFLVQIGADVNFVDADGNTPLFFALENIQLLRHLKARIRKLHENGANVNFKNDKNVTAMTKVS